MSRRFKTPARFDAGILLPTTIGRIDWDGGAQLEELVAGVLRTGNLDVNGTLVHGGVPFQLTPPLITTAAALAALMPDDGDEVYFQTATMAALGVIWHFRYSEFASSAYKWEFIGGGDLYSNVVASALGAGTSWRKPATTPSVAIPIAGDYAVSATCDLNAGVAQTILGVGIGGASVGATVAPPLIMTGHVGSSTERFGLAIPNVVVAALALETLDMRGYTQVSGTWTPVRSSLSVRPIRVTG